MIEEAATLISVLIIEYMVNDIFTFNDDAEIDFKGSHDESV